MSALIYVDLDSLHPVIGDTWHRAWLRAMPEPGEKIRMLCGVFGDAEFEDIAQRRARPGLRQCETCAAAYRVQHNIAPIPTRPSPAPRAV